MDLGTIIDILAFIGLVSIGSVLFAMFFYMHNRIKRKAAEKQYQRKIVGMKEHWSKVAVQEH